jgi:hypothetical protein
LALWFGVLGGALGWAAHLLLSYGLVPVACTSGSDLILHLVTVVTAAICLAAVVVAWWCLRRLDRDRPVAAGAVDDAGQPRSDGGRSDAGRGDGRARALALTGLWTSGFFLMVTVAEGLPVFLQDACL